LENAPHIDPAVAAVAEFRDVECRFAQWLDAHDECLSTSARLAMLDRAGRHQRLLPPAAQIEEIEEIARQESDWHVDYSTALADAAGTVPTTMRGAMALAAVFGHQERMGAPAGLLDRAWRSHARGLAEMPISGWGAL
jgi:hypothetical protein